MDSISNGDPEANPRHEAGTEVASINVSSPEELIAAIAAAAAKIKQP